MLLPIGDLNSHWNVYHTNQIHFVIVYHADNISLSHLLPDIASLPRNSSAFLHLALFAKVTPEQSVRHVCHLKYSMPSH